MAANKVSMSKKAFVTEHKELVKTLKSGNKKALAKEAREQSEELSRVTKIANRVKGKLRHDK